MADLTNDFDEGKKLYDDLRGDKQQQTDQNQQPDADRDVGSQQQPDQSTENNGQV